MKPILDFTAASIVLALALGSLAVPMGCEEEEDSMLLEPVSDCSSADECAAIDGRYDACRYVCAGDITYCQVSCETSADCLDRGLPADYVYCNHARPGGGFCFNYDYDYQPGQCVEDPGPDADDDGGGDDDCYSDCLRTCTEAGGTMCGSDCADLC
jgi:hypothetical protein